MLSPCLPSAYKPNATTGYAQRRVDGRVVGDHVAAWTAVHGPVPAGMVLDHLCHNPDECHLGPRCPHRSCVNPDHMVPVTRGDNARRGFSAQSLITHCPQGHPYDKENTRWNQGRRHCRTCGTEAVRRHRRRRTSVLSAAR